MRSLRKNKKKRKINLRMKREKDKNPLVRNKKHKIGRIVVLYQV